MSVGKTTHPLVGVFFNTGGKRNQSFWAVADESLEDLATVIWGSAGLSGPNKVSYVALGRCGV